MNEAANPAIEPMMREVSEYIAGALGRPLPDAVVEKAQHHILDTIAAIAVGARLKPGKVVVSLPDGTSLDFAISGGILEVQPQVVTVLADTAIRAEDIDEASVRKAKEEAERVLANRSEAMEVAEAQQRQAEVSAQLQALERLRRNHKH